MPCLRLLLAHAAMLPRRYCYADILLQIFMRAGAWRFYFTSGALPLLREAPRWHAILTRGADVVMLA